MDDIYREVILDHYKNPRNFGKIKKPSCSFHLYNSACGDDITIDLVISSQRSGGRKIEEIKFRGNGCAISTASASMLTELVQGKEKKDVEKLGSRDIIKILGIDLSPSRLKCAVLPLEVLQKALSRDKK